MKKAMVSLMLAVMLLTSICSVGTAESAPVKLHAIVSLHPSTNDLEELPIYQQIAEKTNVEIDWEYYRTDWDSKKSLILAGGDLPDFFFANGTITLNDILLNIDYFMPLEDLIAEHAPNIQRFLDTYPSAKAATTFPDGHMYALPHYQPNRPTFMGSMYINLQWLENLNLEMPTTIDELTEVVRHFVNDDPNGNGKKDEIGFEWSGLDSGNFGPVPFMGAFGVYGEGFGLCVNDDGTITYNPASEGFKDFITWLASLNAEGLLDAEMLTQDFSQFKAKTRLSENEVVGVSTTWGLDQINNPNYGILLPMVGPKGYQSIRGDSAGLKHGNDCCLSITNDCVDPVAVIKWADQFYSDEYGLQAYYGAYDTCLKTHEDGSITRICPEDTNVSDWTWTNGMNDRFVGWVSPEMESKMRFDDYWTLNGLSKADFDVAYMPYGDESHNYPLLILTPEDADEVSSINTDLKSIWQTFTARWITEGGIEEQWDSYLTELERAGLSRYLEIYQTAYDNYVKQ